LDIKDRIRNVKNCVVQATPNDSLLDMIERAEGAFSGFRMLYSKNGVGAPLNDSEHKNAKIRGLFSDDNVLAYSDDILRQCQLGEAGIGYIRRVLFDTNLLSDLPRVLEDEDFSSKEAACEILEYVKKHFGGSIDFSFPLLENLRQYCGGNKKFPIRKLAAAYYYDEKISEPRQIRTEKHDFTSFFGKSSKTLDSFANSPDIWSLIKKRDLTYAIMLKVFCICWSNPHQTIESILNQLIEYTLKTYDVLPLKELYFSWKVTVGLTMRHFTPIFEEKDLKNPTSKSVNRISALAWDLYMFRYCETLLTEETSNLFYVPLITTMDNGLLDTLELCPIKAVIMFEDAKYVETIFADEIMFQITLKQSLSASQKNVIRSPKRHINKSKIDEHLLNSEISKLEDTVYQLAERRSKHIAQNS